MFSHVLFGGDYNPEQWNPEVWREDAQLMEEAGVNLVSLGIFAWAKLEPALGQYDFSWLTEIMDLLHQHGVDVNLATPTASPPPWLVHLHPDILPVTADGQVLWYGSRRHYCPHSLAYRASVQLLVRRMAQHFGDHPALALWHIDNEYACHVTECFCETSIAAFRTWLQQRYDGSLDAFNKAWGTDFWSQHYSNWEEVRAPGHMPAQANPMQLLDWHRFCSDSWLECYQEQKKIFREITPNIPLTTNFMRFHNPLDYWKWAKNEDVVSFDSYPDTSNPQWMVEAGMGFDMMRSLKNGQPWLLMEQAPTHVNWRERNATKRPGVMRLGSYQALARGANGIMFFQWRASEAGTEKFHSAIIPHVGTDSRVWRESKALGMELKKFDGMLSSRVQAEVAILFDWENWWALESGDKPTNDINLIQRISEIYAELFNRNITIDFVHPKEDLSQYHLVIMPYLYLICEQAGQNIVDYVANGGSLLMTFFSGLVNENEHVKLGGYPALFRKMLGLWIEEFAPYGDNDANSIQTDQGDKFNCNYWSDIIRLEGAEVLASYLNDYYTGSPAVTRYAFGQGTSYYLGTSLEKTGLAWLISRIMSEAGIKEVNKIPNGVEVTYRNDGTHRWTFILNYSNETVQVALTEDGVNLITGVLASGSIQLGPREVAIIQA
jgi:beta-galactosidase